ncbi:DNA phosphorothioation system sulfurtransferase DndC [Salinibius halmophilus]|uniref:DNA phosphorothioation system sulfurtransferase DndC n=1 Tax=Salinibius halmophilus TaxID=1853216 RepID=UPI000E664687|nr:DNA phosphorothioation system sulfurtransferase DndC [Salinibius halmophilus]
MSLFSDSPLDRCADFIESEILGGMPLTDKLQEIQLTYLADNRPWVLAYSGGKDSTAVAILVYLALYGLPREKLTKPVFVISSDTLVETPVVVDHISTSLNDIFSGAQRDGLPITTHQVVPPPTDTFWTCLLGKGYPAPTRQFRWCTERMKIDPVSEFIKDKVSKYEEVVILLGARTDESASRAQVIKKHKIDGTNLGRHKTLSNAFIYTPIETWSTEDVWKVIRDLDDHQAPWGASTFGLWMLYAASADQGECPLVIDESTPSCGNSRFGCWTCTVVTNDRAMESLVRNGEEWMKPLLEFRDFLSMTGDVDKKTIYRNHKRRTGTIMYQRAKEGEDLETVRKHIPGPYFLKYRKEWLKQLLQMQKDFNDSGREITLITEPELHAIRQEWLIDPNEPDWADELPDIYFDVYGEHLNWVHDDNNHFDKKDVDVLRKVCATYGVEAEMIMKLLDLEMKSEGLNKRSGIFKSISSILSKDWGTLEQIEEKKQALQSKAEFDLQEKVIKDYEESIVYLRKQLKSDEVGL